MTQIQTMETDGRSMSEAVVEAVAAVEGTPPGALSPPLYDVVDPEALDILFAGKTSLGKIVFNYNNYEITVYADDYVAVEDHSR